MYYEEKFINGKLMFRTNPNDKWRDKQNAYAIVANDVYALDKEDRLAVFALFCTHCGSDDPRCQCWGHE